MKKYEYRMVNFGPGKLTPGLLNEYGEEGWLVASINVENNRTVVVTFSREKTEPIKKNG